MINTEIDNLYREIILDHYRNPRNSGKPECFTAEASGNNPSCGDDVTIYLATNKELITDIHFQCSGCAISLASASIMTQAIKSKRLEDVLIMSKAVQCILTGTENFNQNEILKETDIIALTGVKHFPMRIKCATLAWHALDQAIFNALQG
ncbi:MAG: SUF system NifU family Fe-S cluster assembly protein [Puniceicoccales bacterium]|jgi:nitrogen fixation NifU-like protein|nr:SUF system NifU family Fe-S cluster assembly protein [Puniceicoccales bacterium]